MPSLLAPPCWHPTVLTHQGWLVEADLSVERKEKEKEKQKSKRVLARSKPAEEDRKKYYCFCRMVCTLFLLVWP